MLIRKEEPSDYDEVYELVKTSFATLPDDDGTTPDYLNQIRKQDTFIPELSLVAINENNKITGQIVLYKTNIIDKRSESRDRACSGMTERAQSSKGMIPFKTTDKKITELLLSPVSVHPDYFRMGIARLLINESFRKAKELGFKAVFLCGDPEFYKKFGFIPSYKYNIFHLSDKSKKAPWCMACELVSGSLKNVTGTINIV